MFKYCKENSSMWDPDLKECKPITGNYQKFLLNGQGEVVKDYEPQIDPKALHDDIEDLLYY